MEAGINLLMYFKLGSQAIFFLTILVFLVFSLSLAYHTKEYSLDTKKAMATFSIYLIVAATLIIAMTGELLSL
jgi:hypothetical protein